ncbi:porin [Roseateles amylovorans]|uniref:Porin n=1 Tax=Roseateles amylovorans TaxID=2978473 RepID=A0ABY6AX27_9BURK|nr:porin [Roseateles amylovorans]UXH77468.1 porin [Roseateles amylovorans]
MLAGNWPVTAAAATDSLILSGELNVQLNRLRYADADGRARVLNRLDSSASNIRFKGTESLGDDLSASFYVSAGLRTDTGTGGFCNRECFVQLAGPAGAIKLGRVLPIYDDVSLPWYFIEIQGNHNPIALWANCGNGAGMDRGCMDAFITAVRYDTPTWGGFSGSVSVADLSTDLQREKGSSHAYSGGMQYRQGALYLGVAAQKQVDTRYAGARDHGLTLSMEWKGPVTVGLGLERLSYRVAAGGTLTRDYAGLLLSRTWGAQTVWGNAGRAFSGRGSAGPEAVVNNVRRQSQSGASMFSLGYTTRLSKLTKLYAFHNLIVNDRRSRYSFDTSTSAALGTGRRVSSLVVGMSKKF